jgi:tRNA nucleotidyltransferase/poly(A) polymerase
LADNRFKEDALRLVRAVRIVNILNQKLEKNNNLKRKINNLKLFDYDTDTRMSMKKNYYLVQFIAKERLRDEILKVFKMNNPFGFVSLIEDLNILKYIFP